MRTTVDPGVHRALTTVTDDDDGLLGEQIMSKRKSNKLISSRWKIAGDDDDGAEEGDAVVNELNEW